MAEDSVGKDTTAALFGFPATSRRKLEQTLAIIKPEAINNAEEIITILRREGFNILQERRVCLTEDQASKFFSGMYEMAWFSESVTNLSSGEILALFLSGPGAIEHLNELLGPEPHQQRAQFPGCLRNRFGSEGSDVKSGIHGSISESDALRELNFFFPELIVDPNVADALSTFYVNDNVHPILTIGLSELVRERPEEPILWLAQWLECHNPNKLK